MSRCHNCQGNRRSRSYQEGYEEGYRAGLENGYAAGFEDGLNAVRQSIRIPDEDFALGFNDGFNAGAEVGYARGFDSAINDFDRRRRPCNDNGIGVSYPSALQLCSGPNCRRFTLRTRNGVLRFDGYRWSRVCR